MKIPEEEFPELIDAYINGDDIKYQLDDLENNAEFMIRQKGIIIKAFLILLFL